MRIPSVEQVELGNHMELSLTGHADKWARQSNISGRTVAEQSRWMEPEESRSSDSCQTPVCEGLTQTFWL